MYLFKLEIATLIIGYIIINGIQGFKRINSEYCIVKQTGVVVEYVFHRDYLLRLNVENAHSRITASDI